MFRFRCIWIIWLLYIQTYFANLSVRIWRTSPSPFLRPEWSHSAESFQCFVVKFIYGSTFPWRKIRGAVSVLLHVVMSSWRAGLSRIWLTHSDQLSSLLMSVILCFLMCMCVPVFVHAWGGVSLQGALGDVSAIKNDSCYCKQQLILMREYPLYVFD